MCINNLVLRAYLFLTACALFWAGNAVIGRFAVAYVPPFTLSFLRWLLALIFLLPFTWRRLWALYPALYQARFRVLAASLLGISAFNTLQYWALHSTTAINVGLVNAAMPVAMFLLTWLGGQERAGRWQLAGLCLGGVGVLLVVARGSPAVLWRLEFNIGDALMALAVFGFALYSVILRRLPAAWDPLALLSAQLVIGTAALLPFWAVEAFNGHLPALSTTTLAILLYVALLPSLLAYWCWQQAVLQVGGNKAALFMNLTPVFTSVLAMIFLDEQLRWFHLLAMALIFSGIYLAVFRKTRA